MQNMAVAQETPARVMVCGWPGGMGTDSACQVRPSQCAASGRPCGLTPTAWQDAGDRQETLVTGAAGRTRQRVPFQAWAGEPTAVHAFAAAHDTPVSWLPRPWPGERWSCHAVPFQRSMSVRRGRVAP
jgi:hypothetical protein